MTERSPIDLLSLEPEALREELREHFRSRGQPGYRAEQVARRLHEGLAVSFDEMTELPADERAALGARYRLSEPDEARTAVSRDGTVKHLWRFADGQVVESVLIPTDRRLTLCISSQAGCAMGCTFCATGWGGAHGLGPVTNVVYMGMGEPLANRGAVLPSLTLLNRAYGLGARRITVSTVGVVPGILALAERPEQFGLALSLHAPTSELRRELIPLEKRYPLPELVDALRRFGASGGRRVTFEYTMIRGVNDDLGLVDPLAPRD